VPRCRLLFEITPNVRERTELAVLLEQNESPMLLHGCTTERPQHSPGREGIKMSIGMILLIILILALVGVIPAWGHSKSWGYGPSGGLGLVVLVLVILLLMGKI
jgi:hypothetical protein